MLVVKEERMWEIGERAKVRCYLPKIFTPILIKNGKGLKGRRGGIEALDMQSSKESSNRIEPVLE